jgi:putative protease
MKIPELLAPAGSLAMLQTALAFGADAVYAGQPRYSLRVRNNDFGDLKVIQQGLDTAHASRARFYVVSNIYAHDDKIRHYVNNMAPVIAMGPDALIMSDPGLIMLVRENWPDMPIHLSVQANTVNAAAVRFWKTVGIDRVILSRELSLEQVANIRQECPDVEIEVFVHGALCIAYSGRCLLSGYLNHRDANQGSCSNSCRWDYKTLAGRVDASGDVVAVDATDAAYLLEESHRPGNLMPVEEDEHGTYILNSKDLRAIEHIAKLVDMGVDSLKIEGRTKSTYYVARTVQCYRRAIDDAVTGRSFNTALLGQLEGLANRGYTSGFFLRHTPEATQNYLRGCSESGRSVYVGDVVAFDTQRGLAQVRVKNCFAVGDWLEIISPAGNMDVHLSSMENAEAQPISVAPGSGHTVWLPWPPSAVGAFVAHYLNLDSSVDRLLPSLNRYEN